MIKHHSQAVVRSRWLLPLFSLGLGVVICLVSWLGGQLGGGLISLAILAAFGLLILLVTDRSETVRGLTPSAATSGSCRSTCARRRWPGWSCSRP